MLKRVQHDKQLPVTLNWFQGLVLKNIKKSYRKKAIFWKRNTLYKCSKLHYLFATQIYIIKNKRNFLQPFKPGGLVQFVKFCCVKYIKKVNFLTRINFI